MLYLFLLTSARLWIMILGVVLFVLCFAVEAHIPVTAFTLDTSMDAIMDILEGSG